MAKVIEPINGIIRPDLRTEDVVKEKVSELVDMVNVLVPLVEMLLEEVADAYMGIDCSRGLKALEEGRKDAGK